MLSLQPATSTGGGGDGEGGEEVNMVDVVASDILSKLPGPFDVEQASIKYPVKYEESMNTVFVQELIRFNKLLNAIIGSLNNLRKAVKGLVVMSAELEQVANSLTDGLVPAMWASAGYPSLKPLGSWVTDLVKRLEFFQNWFENGPPAVFWMSGFFFTQGFMTGTLQNFARQHLIPIDMLAFDFKILDDVPEEGASDGVYVQGLFMEGARWDSAAQSIAESEPKVLYTQMPAIWLKVAESSALGSTDTGFYICPLYRTAKRMGTLSTTGHSTNFVMGMTLPSNKPSEHWVKRGVAMLCALQT